MADNTQNILINIKADTAKATDDIKKLNKQVASLDKQLGKGKSNINANTKAVKKMGASFVSLGQHLSRLVVIYGSFTAITDTVKTFASFEQAIVTLGAISGVTGDDLKALEEKALELGESTVFSASQVAEGMTEMARAGLSASEQLAGIEGVLNLSINGMVSLQEASLIATTAMNGFGLEAEDIPILVDVMSKSINTSAQTLTQLGNAIAKVAPVAKDMGLSFQETIATLGVLADAGRRGAEAGTQLKIALLRLGATPEARKYIEELGISMYDANGKLKPFTEQLATLQGGLVGLTESMQKTYKARIFGTEALASGQIMLDNIEKIKFNTELLSTSFGYAEANAQQMMNTLQGSYKELLSALEGLQIKIGKNLSPALRQVVEDATEFIRAIDAEDINEFSDAIAGLINGVVEVGYHVSAFVTILKDFDSALGDWGIELLAGTALLIKFRKELKALLLLAKAHPILAILGVAITGITVALTHFQKQVDDMNRSTDSFNKSFSGLADVIEKVYDKTEELDAEKARTYLKELIQGSDNAQTEINNLRKEIDELEADIADPWTWTNDEEVERVTQAKNQIEILKKTMANATEAQKKLTDVGTEAIRVRNEEIKANNLLGQTYSLLSEKSQALSADEEKEHAKTLKRYTARQTSLEKTLGTMKAKERRFADEVIAIEKELADIRKQHVNERGDYELNYSSKIADLRASNLSDLGQYNDAQKRADQQLSLAKQALLKGDLETAERHQQEYLRLIQVNATSEIKEGEKVVRSKKAGIDELIRDEQAGHAVGLELLNQKQAKEEQAIQDKLVLKQQELALHQLQIDLQIKSAELMAKLVKELTGIDYSDTFTEFKTRASEAEKQIDDMMAKQRVLKIDGELNKAPVEQDLAEVVTKGENTTITAEVDSDTTKATNGLEIWKTNVNDDDAVYVKVEAPMDEPTRQFTEFKVGVEDKTLIANANLDTAQADASYSVLQSKVKTKIVTPTDLDTTASDAKNRRMVSDYSKTITRTLITREQFIPARQNGGLIPDVPRFNTGGFAEKSGKLGGYGGGDKIKALLEAGEFIVRKEAVKSLGLARLHQINQGQIPRFKVGGSVSAPTKIGTNSVNATPNKTVNLNFQLGDKTFQATTDEQVANSLANYLRQSEF